MLRNTGKMIVVGVLVIISWIASLFVLAVVSERTGRQSEAEVQIAEQWGRPQLIAGPVIVVPVKGTVNASAPNSLPNPNGSSQPVRHVLYILPKELNIDTKLEPEVRSRGIFNAPVYHSRMTLSGSFEQSDLTALGLSPAALLWNEASLVVGLSDTRSVNSGEDAVLAGKRISFLPGAPEWNVGGMGIHAKLPTSFTTSIDKNFNFSLDLSGSKSIRFLPLGENTNITAVAPWGSPSFVGAYLPDEESLTKDNFTASWHISALGRSYPNAWIGTALVSLYTDDQNYNPSLFGSPIKSPAVYSGSGDEYGQALAASAFGVNLFREVTFYTLVSRTVKYAILFIALTFLAFYLFEVISGTRVHPFQYLLIGAALVLFYLLLLSFSEHIGFALSYLLSSILTLGMVTAYSASVLKARGRAWIIAAILAVLYAYLYAILQLENYALLFGTLFLFVALAAIMRATRKIEWYKERE